MYFDCFIFMCRRHEPDSSLHGPLPMSVQEQRLCLSITLAAGVSIIRQAQFFQCWYGMVQSFHPFLIVHRAHSTPCQVGLFDKPLSFFVLHFVKTRDTPKLISRLSHGVRMRPPEDSMTIINSNKPYKIRSKMSRKKTPPGEIMTASHR